jgi:hypothetical protein
MLNRKGLPIPQLLGRQSRQSFHDTILTTQTDHSAFQGQRARSPNNSSPLSTSSTHEESVELDRYGEDFNPEADLNTLPRGHMKAYAEAMQHYLKSGLFDRIKKDAIDHLQSDQTVEYIQKLERQLEVYQKQLRRESIRQTDLRVALQASRRLSKPVELPYLARSFPQEPSDPGFLNSPHQPGSHIQLQNSLRSTQTSLPRRGNPNSIAGRYKKRSMLLVDANGTVVQPTSLGGRRDALESSMRQMAEAMSSRQKSQHQTAWSALNTSSPSVTYL